MELLTKKPKVIVIVGPTGSGKTSLALEVAQQFQGEIISADSRQIYRRLDIGTEKISREEMQNVPHHLIDICDVGTVYTASDFKKDAEEAISEILRNGNVPIIAGGTFFYIDTLLGKMSPAPVEPNQALREKLESKTTEELFGELQKKDPRRAESIDQQNKRRLVRALEIVDVLKKVPMPMQTTDSLYDVLIIGLEVDKVELRKKLRSRAEQALHKGLVEETKNLLASGVTKERLSEIGHEYRIVMEYIDGALTQQELIQKFEEKNWQYAKRQLMWLKRDETIRWFKREDTDAIISSIRTFLSH